VNQDEDAELNALILTWFVRLGVFLALLFLAGIAGALLAGCGGGDPEPQPTPPARMPTERNK